MNWLKSACISILLLLAVGCNRVPLMSVGFALDIPGFFLLNEGQEGKNNCTLDYYDYNSGIYDKNIFQQRNPEVRDNLGDGGNDLAIYGTKLFVVMSHSNLVEVLDVRTGWHIDQISIPNCRSIACKDNYVYVSSYDSPVETGPDLPLGYVAKIDTSSLEIIETCRVGYQPEEMAVVGDYLYVANSGNYRAPDYDNTISVIDLHIFREIQKIEVAPNLHRMEADAYGKLWVSNSGDYYDIPSMTFVLNTENNSICDVLDLLPCSDMALCGDSLYVISNVWNYFSQSSVINYAIVDVNSHHVVSRKFITDGADAQIQNPYGIAANPKTHEIFVTDARDSVTPGKVYCFSPDGKQKWSANTGDIPSRIAFTVTPLL